MRRSTNPDRPGESGQFEQQAYPHAPRDIWEVLKANRDAIRKFLASPFGRDRPNDTQIGGRK